MRSSTVLRSLLRQPSTTVVALLVLAIGIGATTAVFSVLYSVAFKPLPWQEPDRIVRLGDVSAERPEDARGTAFLLGNIAPLRDDLAAFDSAAGYMGHQMTLTGREEPARLEGARVSVDLFRVLGREAEVGRVLDREDEAGRREDVIVLNRNLARRLFGSAEQALGQSLQLDGEPREVVGVMPEDFAFPDRGAEFWVPLYPEPPSPEDEGMRAEIMLPAIARLAAGATVQEARIQGQGFLDERGGEREIGRAFVLQGLRAQRLAPLRDSLRLLVGAVVLVLLMACSNVASLLLARGAHREREMATRLSLGARRGDLARLLFAESSILAALGGALGVTLAWVGVRLLRAIGPADLMDFDEVSLNLPVVGFALAVAVLSTLVFGVLPALQASGARPGQALGRTGGTALGGMWRGRSRLGWLRAGLTLVQVSMAIVLLAGAGLLANSFLRLVAVDPGYEPEDLLTFRLSPPMGRYGAEQRIDLVDRVRSELEALPGVESAGAVNFLPLFRGRIQLSVSVDGQEPVDPHDAPTSEARLAGPGYFETMRIPLLAGRTFVDGDLAGGDPVIVVNRAFVDQILPEGVDAVGQGTGVGRIVGVVGDVLLQGLDSEPGPTFYQPISQLDPRMAMLLSRISFVARARDPEALVPAVRERLVSIDPSLPVEDARPMVDRLSESVATPRFFAAVLGLFAGVALVLAVTGVYGVLAFNASRRAKETGIRMALGEQRGAVVARTVVEGLGLTAVGVAVGVVLALLASRTLSSLLFGVEPGDLLTLALVSVLLLGTALLASLVPAARAASVDPVVVLREE